MLRIRSMIYKFKHFMFKWNKDADGDIVFSVFGILHFIKYKEHTVIKFGIKNYEQAPKYIGNLNLFE